LIRYHSDGKCDADFWFDSSKISRQIRPKVQTINQII
jgi:hypothetical protein